ncbi:6-hydroxymethylpterin diphosphokinase MptE-like protein [Desulfobacter sp.]|uniref:6-hydroxymethylpterin diphosphokinase MptE-like protein n=1 Tax=Desulfobacter sp. TaxID=2294 RepID=UPI00257FC488|nr:6-hydroxymethylpterin diphosphokinase MptE-like protein [Desulfobacter sp.]
MKGSSVKAYVSEGNYQLLKKNHPHVLDQLEAMNPEPVGEVLLSKSGQPNLKIIKDGNEVFIHPEQNPESEKEMFTAKVPEGFSGVEVILGMGLGYGVKGILEKRKMIRHLVIIENEPGIFLQALKYEDLSDVLTNPKVLICITPDDEDILSPSAQKGILLEDSQILEHPVLFKLFDVAYGRLKKMFFDRVNHLNIAGSTRVKFGETMVRNRLTLLKNLGRYFRFDSLINAFEEVPAYIVAGGPSLDRDLKYLKQIKRKALIFSVDTALPALLENDTHPDFISSIDYKDIIYEKIASKINNIQDYACLLTSSATTPLVHQNFPGKRKFFLFSENGIDHWLNALSKGNHYFASGPSVAHLNFVAAKIMGCSPIIFLGQDLCYPTGQTHVKSAVLTHGDAFQKDLKSGNGVLKVPGVEGGEVITTRGMENMKYAFEKLIANNPGYYINCTSGGAHIQGTRFMPIEHAVKKYVVPDLNVQNKFDRIFELGKIDGFFIVDKLCKDLEVIKDVGSLVVDSDLLITKINKQIPKLRKNWKRQQAIPSNVRAMMQRLDEINLKIDNYDTIWQILEEMTTSALRKSEQMIFEIKKFENKADKYLEWLKKTIDRLAFVNTVRRKCLNLLEQGISDAVEYSKIEKNLLEGSPEQLDTALALADFYISNKEYSLAKPYVQICAAETLNDSSAVQFFLGCLAAQMREFEQMNLFFSRSVEIDAQYQKRIDAFRTELGDQYVRIVKHVTKNDMKVAKKMLFQGLEGAPYHQGLYKLLKAFADSDMALLCTADSTRLQKEHESLVSYWVHIIERFPLVYAYLSNEHMGVFFYFQGKIKFSSGKRPDAFVLFRKSVGYLPFDDGLILRIADFLLCSHEYDQGIHYLNKAIEIDGNHAVYWERFGDFLFEKGRIDEGASAYEQAQRYFPEKRELKEKLVGYCLEKGNRSHQQGEYEQAERYYEEGIRTSPENGVNLVCLYNNLGSALKNSGHLNDAMVAYNEALKINPGYAEALYNKGELFQSLGNTEAAVHFYERAVKEHPDFAIAYSQLGNLLISLGQNEKGEQMCARAIKLTSKK